MKNKYNIDNMTSVPMPQIEISEEDMRKAEEDMKKTLDDYTLEDIENNIQTSQSRGRESEEV